MEVKNKEIKLEEKDNKIYNKYLATMLVHSLGDTIGFKNGEWEFKGTTPNITLELISEFIALGGVNQINLKDWLISDDTIFHISTANSLLRYNNKLSDNFYNDAKDDIIIGYNRIIDDIQELGKNRYIGKKTVESISEFREDYDGRNSPYDKTAIGNGIAMKSLCIGLAFYEEDKLDELIECSIMIGKMTHNNAHGYLAGFTSAYFVSLAIRNIPIEKWVYMLIETLDSDKIKKYVNQKVSEELMDYFNYIRYWRIYLDTKFLDGKPIKVKSVSNLFFRTKYYYDNFIREYSSPKILSGTGYSSVIIAYDALLDCDGIWEKLIFYGILHPFDSDTVGAIAGGLYGALYGFGDIPENMLKYLEEKPTVEKLGDKLYKKFYLKKEINKPKRLSKFKKPKKVKS